MIIHNTESTVNIAPWKTTDKIRIDEIYSVFLQKSNQNYSFPGEFHNFWEVMYVISGSVKVVADKKVFNLTKGHFIFHKPLEFHRFTVTSDATNLLIFSFNFEGVLQEKFSQQVFLSTPGVELVAKNFVQYIRANTPALPNELYSPKDFYTLLQPLESWTYRHMVQTYIYQIILLLHDENSIPQEHSSKDSTIYKKAVEYMQDRIFEQITVDEIAEHVHVSTSNLKRAFTKYAKLGVHQFFLNQKLIAAIQLLQSGKTVCETAEKLGFNNQSYFSTTFKRELGISPSDIKHLP